MLKNELIQALSSREIVPTARNILDQLDRYQGGGPIHRIQAARFNLLNLLDAAENGRLQAKTFGELNGPQADELYERLYIGFSNGGYLL